LTAYTAGDTSGTVTRGQEGTSDIDHDSGVTWLCGPLADDLATFGASAERTINTVTGSYTATLDDASTIIEMTGISSDGDIIAVNDTFTDADGTFLEDHVGETGATWTCINRGGPTALTIEGDTVSCTDGGENVYAYLPSGGSGLPSPDYTVQANMSTGDFTYALWARSDGAFGRGYLAQVGASGVVELYKNDGSFSSLGAGTYTPGDLIALKCAGATIEVLVNGTSIISVTDTGITDTGVPGFYGGGTGYVDNYQVIYTPSAGDGSTLIIPANADVPFDIGTELVLCQAGAQQLDVAGDTGVTIDYQPSLSPNTTDQWATVIVRKLATDKWVLSGALAVSGSGDDGVNGAWVTPMLEAGNYTQDPSYPIRYMKDAIGFIHMQGRCEINAGGDAFVFPEGFRPGIPGYYASVTDGATTYLYVDMDGSCQLSGSGHSYGDGVTFLAEN
jgi:hypothetical protein